MGEVGQAAIALLLDVRRVVLEAGAPQELRDLYARFELSTCCRVGEAKGDARVSSLFEVYVGLRVRLWHFRLNHLLARYAW